MIVYRLTKRLYADRLDGVGAAKSNNRWNSRGTRIVYTASSRALAMVEVLVHVTTAQLPSNYVMIEIDIPDSLPILTIKQDDLPHHWHDHPPVRSTRRIGDDFIGTAEQAVMSVPSAVVRGDMNYLINPVHRRFHDISIVGITDFHFDQRLRLG